MTPVEWNASYPVGTLVRVGGVPGAYTRTTGRELATVAERLRFTCTTGETDARDDYEVR